MLLKDLPASTRPREKMLTLGPAALADAELLALLLRTGRQGVSVLQMAAGTAAHQRPGPGETG
jgi:DNA repair protein RadC